MTLKFCEIYNEQKDWFKNLDFSYSLDELNYLEDDLNYIIDTYSKYVSLYKYENYYEITIDYNEVSKWWSMELKIDLIKCMRFFYPRLLKYNLPFLFDKLMEHFHKELLKGGLKIPLSDLSIIALNVGKIHRDIDEYGLIVEGIEDILMAECRQDETQGMNTTFK